MKKLKELLTIIIALARIAIWIAVCFVSASIPFVVAYYILKFLGAF